MEPEPTKPTKAIFAGLIALTGGLATAIADNAITALEGVIVAGTVITAVAAVYGVTNKPSEV